MAEEIAGTGAPGYRERPVAGAMAMAGWACRCVARWGTDCGRSGQICRLDGRRACGSASTREHLVALHGFIKKTRTTLDEDLALARERKKELEQ
jgi:hypothetical protein